MTVRQSNTERTWFRLASRHTNADDCIMRRAAKSGFSLIELLVVMAVLAVLVTLLLPAVNKVREAAHATACRNNLHQIGMALQNYVDAHGCLPPGSVNDTGPVRSEPVGIHHSWIVALLPHLGEEPLSRQFVPGVSVYDRANDAAREVLLPVLVCPSDPGPQRPSDRQFTPQGANYAGVHHPVETPIDVTNHGVLFLNSRVGMSDIPDGSTHTLVVGEKLREPDDLGWASGTRSTLRNAGSILGGTTPAGTRLVGPPADRLEVGGFGSAHASMVTFLFVDGHVENVSLSMATSRLQQLADRADGTVVDEF
jgi:prepilin-type N-terminal cleavage/methylation domain-containing protein/prepilin-type processing-associated H-X9-DG protein